MKTDASVDTRRHDSEKLVVTVKFATAAAEAAAAVAAEEEKGGGMVLVT